MTTQDKQREWRDTIWDLRQAALTAKDATLLDRARIGMLEILDELNTANAELAKARVRHAERDVLLDAFAIIQNMTQSDYGGLQYDALFALENLIDEWPEPTAA